MKKAKTISVFEFMSKFPNEEEARNWVEKRRWGDCPSCAYCKDPSKITKQEKREGYYWCGKCRKYFTVKTNTVMDSSKIPVRTWLYAMYLITTARKGVSSMQLSKEVGITQKSAWFLLHRLREACKDNSNELLEGVVEVDEAYFGGKEKHKSKKNKTKGNQGRSTKTKTAVVGMRSRDGKIKAARMKKVDGKNIQSRLDENVKPGSILCTDEATIYKPVTGYHKLKVNHSLGEYVNGLASTNGIESVWAVMKRGYNGTFHHFSRKHIDRYVDEFTFRLNQCSVTIDTIRRIENFVTAMDSKVLRYKSLIK